MKLAQSMSKWRFYLAAGILCTLPLALVWHLANLQVIPSQGKDFRFLQDAGAARTLRNERINAYRGVITDRNGELLAVSTPVTSVCVNPQKIKKSELKGIAGALDITVSELEGRLNKYKNKRFMYLARHLPPHKAEHVLEHRFAGVFALEEYQRFYPAGETVSHVIGFTDIDEKGKEGIELAFDHWLAGEPGIKRVVKDLKGNVVRDLGLLKSPRSGNDLRLTIDLRLQYLAYRELKNAVSKQNAKSGSLVMMDVESGELLAMVNQPSYNPNNRNKVDASQIRNRAFTDVFEPGSTMKPFTVMAALESGRYSPSFTIDTNPGYFFVGNKVIPDPVNYGVIDLAKIISKSSQVGISKLALAMDPQIIWDMYFRAGFGQSSGVGFPGESVGMLPNRSKWHPIEQATFSYGYGLSVNAVQLAQAYTVIASEGKFNPATLIKQAKHIDARQVVPANIAKQVAEMLRAVIQPGGTATSAEIASFPVAGKTGTAHKVGVAGYADDKYIALFAGFAPVSNPKIVAVVIIDEPPSDGEYSGGKSAAPVFASAVEKALHILRVPPVQEKPSQVAALALGPDQARLR